MDIVIGILELIGLVLVVVYLFTHSHGRRAAMGGCGCSGGASKGGADLSFPNPQGACS